MELVCIQNLIKKPSKSGCPINFVKYTINWVIWSLEILIYFHQFMDLINLKAMFHLDWIGKLVCHSMPIDWLKALMERAYVI